MEDHIYLTKMLKCNAFQAERQYNCKAPKQLCSMVFPSNNQI